MNSGNCNNSNWNCSGVGHFGVDLQRRDPRSDVEGVLVHHRLEAVVGGHRGQRGVVGRGDGAVHGCRGAVVRQLQVHAVGGAVRGHHALQHVEGRLVSLVRETRGQRALQRGDAAPVRSHLPVRGARAAAVARGAIAGASALLFIEFLEFLPGQHSLAILFLEFLKILES